nr:uncharacterized protein LOC116768057 [Danaus plexippus plexippus]
MTLPDQSNLVRWGKGTEKTCYICGKAVGTARHLLVGCKVLLDSGQYSRRHDRVLEIIREAGTDLFELQIRGTVFEVTFNSLKTVKKKDIVIWGPGRHDKTMHRWSAVGPYGTQTVTIPIKEAVLSLSNKWHPSAEVVFLGDFDVPHSNWLGLRFPPGPDGVHGRVLALSLVHLGEALRELFDLCLRSGQFPRAWKEGRLCLLPKGSRPLDSASAVRPVVVLNEAGKALEKIMATRLVRHLEEGSGPGLSEKSL